MTASSIDQVATLAGRVATEFAGTALGAAAAVVAAGRHEPLRLAVAGRVKAGKSTLLNALVGEPLAPTDAGECTRVVTWYRHGLTRGARVERVDGSAVDVPVERTPDALVVDLGTEVDAVRRLDIRWPASRLSTITLIDTPGIGSVRHRGGAAATELVNSDDPDHAVDAVVYLTNQVHPDDWRFLEAFTDGAGIRPDPSCAVALLSRADEVAGGAADALDHAAVAAARAAADPAVRRSCQTVLPVSALLAAGAVRLTIEQHRQLVALAGDPDVRARLRTASRFVENGVAIGGVDTEVRRALLAQLGLFGVRAAVAMLGDRPTTSAAQLVASLRAMSGLDELVDVIEHQFLRRRDALRTRTGLRALWSAATAHGPGVVDAIAELERIEAADHELAELGLLAAWRAGQLRLRPEHGADLERWLDPPEDEGGHRRGELLESLDRWRQLAEHPLTRPTEAAAAQVVARSVERRLA